MTVINTVSNAAGRNIDIKTPAIFLCETLADIAKIQGEDLCIQHIKSQLHISFRSMVRNLLEKKIKDADGNDTEDFVNDDAAIQAMDFTDWKPVLRVVKSAEEKALEALGNLDPAVREAVLANFAASKAKKKD